MKFRYYVTDLMDGIVKGTNDSQIAQSYAENEEYFVVNSDTGMWLQTDGETAEIQEIF